MMKLQQLETFYWAAKLGSFGAAAERLNATQSAISMRIRELERKLGVMLFDRSKRQVSLTDKGRELLEYSTRLLDLQADIEHRISASNTLSGTVRLGVAEVVTTTWLPRLIREISTTYPQVRLEIDEELTHDLMRGLRAGQLDLVLAPGHVPEVQSRTISLGKVTFRWMACPELGLGNQKQTPRSLAQYPVVGLKDASFHHAGIVNWFRQANTRCQYLVRCKSVAVAASMTMAGSGIAYLPVRCFREEIKQGRLVVVPTVPELPPVEFVAALNADDFDPLGVRVAELAAQISEFQWPE